MSSWATTALEKLDGDKVKTPYSEHRSMRWGQIKHRPRQHWWFIRFPRSKSYKSTRNLYFCRRRHKTNIFDSFPIANGLIENDNWQCLSVMTEPLFNLEVKFPSFSFVLSNILHSFFPLEQLVRSPFLQKTITDKHTIHNDCNADLSELVLLQHEGWNAPNCLY